MSGEQTGQRASPLSVLLVDDDPAQLRILQRWLDPEGYRVRLAPNGRDALEQVQADPPDLIVTDWEMPELNGLELCRAVRALRLPRYAYILFLSVRSDTSQRVEGLELGADDFLAKPVQREEFLARIRAGMRIVRLERRLGVLASTDPLTGLMSQRSLAEILEKEWHRARRHQLPLSCVMIDLDYFKRVNDQHGHPAGDQVLRSMAEVLADSVRRSDHVARCGGEEFCVLLPETPEDRAAQWAERVRRRIARLPIEYGTLRLAVTASFGVAQRRDDTPGSDELVDAADQALRCAKQSGRDRVVCFTSLSAANDVDLEETGGYGGLFRGMLARHVMTPVVSCLDQDERVGRAAEFFLRSRISSVPVVNAQGQMVGMLAEKDLMAAMVAPGSWGMPIRTYMKPQVICYEEDTPVRTIYEFLCRVSLRRVVITAQGVPVGTISGVTLLRWFRNLARAHGVRECGPDPRLSTALGPAQCRLRMTEAVHELADEVARLQGGLDEDAGELLPRVVGGATRMQELVEDLLAFSQGLSGLQTTEGPSELQLSTSHLD